MEPLSILGVMILVIIALFFGKILFFVVLVVVFFLVLFFGLSLNEVINWVLDLLLLAI